MGGRGEVFVGSLAQSAIGLQTNANNSSSIRTLERTSVCVRVCVCVCVCVSVCGCVCVFP